jgi:hypothetical protein
MRISIIGFDSRTRYHFEKSAMECDIQGTCNLRRQVLCLMRQILRVTPAMEAGIAGHALGWEEIISHCLIKNYESGLWQWQKCA